MNHRFERARSRVQNALSELIPWAIKDPRVHAVDTITVTAVKLSPDYRHARVAVSINGDDEQCREAAMAALTSATPYLRRELGGRLQLRHIPELVIELDTGTEHALRVEKILAELAAERAVADESSEAGDVVAGTGVTGEVSGDKS